MTNKDHHTEEYLEALIDRAVSPSADEDLPPQLAAIIVGDGKQMIGRQTERNVFADRVQRWWQQPALAWGVALASLVLAVLIGVGPATEKVLNPSQLDALLANRSDAVQLEWAAMGDPDYAEAGGYVRWNDATQQGVMRLSGLPVNNPSQAQYQLWIVDPDRDDNPVDGGVFDIVDGDNLIAINAKLNIDSPKAFAITLEQPGGVVVSDGPLLVIASG